jgi:RimJ/RimL family protein N-acetyltransferase
MNNVLELKNVIVDKKNEANQNKALFWSITEVEEKEFIGFIKLMNYKSYYFDLSYNLMGSLKDSPEFSKYIQREGWEMEYALLTDSRGKGIMTKSIDLVLKFCVSNNLKQIYAKVNSMSNKPSIGVLLKNRFKQHLPLQNQNGELGMIYKFSN